MAAALCGILLLLSSSSAWAQEPEHAAPNEPVPMWMTTFGKQLRVSLESDDPWVVKQALQHITHFATYYGDTIDFKDTVPSLIDLYTAKTTTPPCASIRSSPST
jgi:hypothetical protein